MAKLHIIEYAELPVSAGGHRLPIAAMPAIAEQVVTYTSNTASAAFDKKTRFVRLIADAKAHLNFGTTPVADADAPYIPADLPEYFGVRADDKVAAYDGTT